MSRRPPAGEGAGPADPAEVRRLLERHRSELSGELRELAEPVRAPGVQRQFGKRAGDHTSDAVLQMTRSMTASQLTQLAAEIDRALAKLSEGTYGRCDDCGGPVGPERLEALPWAVLCVSCKAAATAGRPSGPRT